MGGKLSFKGEPKKKKRKTKTISAVEQRQQEEEEAADGWQLVPTSTLALGPIYFTLPITSITSTPLCIALQPTTGKIYPYALPLPDKSNSNAKASSSAAIAALELDAEDLEALVEDDDAEDGSGGIGTAGPSDVHHVWVCSRVMDSENKITLRSGTGKFLAADEVGVVTADREARGMQEEWTIENSERGSTKGLIIRSAYNKILSVDVVAGGKMELRADGEEEDETSRWKVWMQGEYVNKARKAIAEKQGAKTATVHEGLVIVGDLGSAENEYIQKYQARGQGRLVASKEDVKGLKRARAEGKLGEAMLERRVKLKADRYC